MRRMGGFDLFIKLLTCIALVSALIKACMGAESLCKLRKLEVVSLSRNLIHGTIPSAISYCTRLRYLNLSSNTLSGRVPRTLAKLKYLESLDISNNPSMIIGSNIRKGSKSSYDYFEEPVSLQRDEPEVMQEDNRQQDIVFFVEDRESFKLDDLLEASADLQSQSICSSLYMVILKNNATYAVKRLKKLQVSLEDFSRTMRRIGNLNHRNILPLVGYSCTNDEKLIFYKYQSKGSLLNLLQGYIEGKREFPWRLRLAIASGLAKGLAFIYQNRNDDEESIPHGNLKLSNILLGENMEPLISEYGIPRLLDPKKNGLFANGYAAPEKSLSEKGDVFSFGVILLELLTGKMVEKTGVDLPKWVKSMVSEEWTGEVFDKGVPKAALQWAFPLLNIALKCVSHSPQDRPTALEASEKIDEGFFKIFLGIRPP
ncbi:RNA-binding family protein isoform 1 [Hibiscus syriacus]|uniref:RNA-binding family protein isoform 1 n=1 Tax=Hibiscus syriacus TaxID=106335 RepID=A0A6A2ZRQ8_HIBSY|nr:RNA-binding family protein isoform 1 [Hibiscus syriacus]